MQKALICLICSLWAGLTLAQNPLAESRWRETIPVDSTDDPTVYQFSFMKKGELTATRVHYKWTPDMQKWVGVTAEQFCDGRDDSYSAQNQLLHIQPREKYASDEDLYFHYKIKGDSLILHRARVWKGSAEGLFGIWDNRVYAEGLPNNQRSQKIELTKDFKVITFHRTINDTNTIQLFEDRWIETVANRNAKSICPPEMQVVCFQLIGDQLYTWEETPFAKLLKRPSKKD